MSVLQFNRFDKAALTMLKNTRDFALLPGDSCGFGIFPQEQGIKACIEMKGIGNLRQGRVSRIDRPHEFSKFCCFGLNRIFINPRCQAVLIKPLPIGVERDSFHVDTIFAEGMEIGVPLTTPVYELNTQLETALGAPDKVIFADAKHAVENVDLWDCSLTDAHGSDRVGLNQRDFCIVTTQYFGERGRRHPSGGPATHDCYAANAVVGHFILPCNCA